MMHERMPKALNITGLPPGVNIWLNSGNNNELVEPSVRVGRYYETAATVLINSVNPMPVVFSEASDNLNQILVRSHLEPTDWMAAKKFIMEHTWLLSEGYNGYMDSWTVNHALALEEFYGDILEYEGFRLNNTGHIELFEADVAGMMHRNEISTDLDMSYHFATPPQDSDYLLPMWRDSVLPEGGPDCGMVHILQNHEKISRIKSLFERGAETKSIVTKCMSISGNTYEAIKKSILSKTERGVTNLTSKESEVVDFIITKVNKKDIFPETMSESKIRAMIKNAYENAKKDGSIQIQGISVWDRINQKGAKDFRLQRLYSGVAGRITIHFWFAFDDQEISSAYPMNNKMVK